MATNAVTICSNALLELGANPISSLSEQTAHARLCANLYPTMRDDVLRSHYWKCATKRVILSPLSTPPAFGWGYQFALPGDWLRTKQVGDDGCPDEYEQEGMTLLMRSQTCKLIYIFRNENEGSYTRNLVRLLECEMAARIAYAVTKSASLRDSKIAEAQLIAKTARAVDGMDNPPEQFQSGSFVESRFSSGAWNA